MKRCCASSASYFFKLRVFICASAAPVDGTVHAVYIQIVLIDESAAARLIRFMSVLLERNDLSDQWQRMSPK
jgi:hypothetical protein